MAVFTKKQTEFLHFRTIKLFGCYPFVERHGFMVYDNPNDYGKGAFVEITEGLEFVENLEVLELQDDFAKVQILGSNIEPFWMHLIDLQVRPNDTVLALHILLGPLFIIYNLFTGYYFTKSN